MVVLADFDIGGQVVVVAGAGRGIGRVLVLVAKQMILQGGGGSIVNIASQAGILGSPGRAVYSAAKAGLINLTRSLATEWGSYSIRVNAVAPGITLTPPVERALRDRPAFAAEVRERILLGQAEPREVGAPVVFLLSRAASMITGRTLVVDGGWTAAWTTTKDVPGSGDGA